MVTLQLSKVQIQVLQRLAAEDRFYGSANYHLGFVSFVEEGLMSSQSSDNIRCSCSFARILQLSRAIDFISVHSFRQIYVHPVVQLVIINQITICSLFYGTRFSTRKFSKSVTLI